jgi:hypothetical protein
MDGREQDSYPQKILKSENEDIDARISDDPDVERQ